MDLSKIYSKRPDWAHKGNFGSVLVIAGSKLYTGSAALAGIASLRTGADLVTVASPQRSADIAAQTLPDLITYPLKGDFLTTKHVDDIMDLSGVRKINSVVLGCGLGRHVTTMSAVRKLISKFSVPLVLDADALVAVSEEPEVLRGKHFVMTPHIAELAALLNLEKINEDFDSRMSNAKEAARRYGGVVLLKGHVDIITDGASTITNNTGTPFMTKGRVEKANGTLQDRLVKEMRLRGILSIEAGNAYLPQFVEAYNRKFAVCAKDAQDAHRVLLESEKLEDIFVCKSTRTLSKNLEFSYKNCIYQLKIERPTYAMRFAKVIVLEDWDEQIRVYYKGRKLDATVAQRLPKTKIVDSKELYQEVEEIVRKPWKPAKDHPWRNYSL